MGTFLRDSGALAAWLAHHHGEVIAAQSRVEQAQADLGSSRLLLPNPTLDFTVGNVNVGRAVPGVSAGLGSARFDVGVTQTIELGKRGPRADAADLRVEAARKSFEATLADKIADARAALARVAYLRGRMTVVDENLGTSRAVADLEKTRVEQGALSGSDYDRLLLDTLSLESEAARARSDLAGALSACASALFAPCEVEGAELADVDGAAPLPAALPLERAGLRSDIAAARLEVAASTQDAVLARRRWIPDPSVRVGYAHDLSFPSAPADSIEVGITVPLPFYDRGQYDATKAMARAKEADANANVLAAVAEANVASLVNRKAFLESTLAIVSSSAVPKSKGVLEATSKAFDHGGVSMTDLLIARRTHLAIVLGQIDLRFEYFGVRNDIRRALGLDADLARAANAEGDHG